MIVLPNGLAIMNSQQNFTFSLNASSISPTVAGTGGFKNIMKNVFLFNS